MPQVPTSDTAVQWAAALDEVAQRIGPRFPRTKPRQRVLAYLRGLLSPVERKNGCQLAEQAGDRAPYGIQHLLGRAAWDADAVRDDLQQYAVQHLGDRDGVLVVDETGFLKKGEHSVGVQRQYSGTAGRIENCQIGVFLAYATARGHTLIDHALYLPEEWAHDRPRREAAGVPPTVRFATKPRLAQDMIERAREAGVPFRWVTGDAVYSNDGKLRLWLEEQHVAHVLGVSGNHFVWRGMAQHKAHAIAAALPDSAWQRLSAGAGSKGPRWYDWAAVKLNGMTPGYTRWLLLRRHVEKPAEQADDPGVCPDPHELGPNGGRSRQKMDGRGVFRDGQGRVRTR